MSKCAKAEKITLVLSLLGLIFLGTFGRSQEPNSKSNSGKAKTASELEKLKKAAASDKRLAEKMMPTAEEMKKGGEWKLPWELPVISMPLPEADRHTDLRVWRAEQDRYWENRAYASPYLGLGLSPGDIVKRIEENTKVLKDKGPFDGNAITTMNALDLSRGPLWRSEIEYSVQLSYMTQQQTRFTLCRAHKWDDRIREATEAKWNIARRYRKDSGAKDFTMEAGGPIIFDGPETRDPEWAPVEKRLWEALGGSRTVLEFMWKHEIGWTSAVVHVRKLNPDAIGGDPKGRLVKDLTEEDAKRLQEKFNSASQALMGVATPIIEKQLEDERVFIRKLKDQGFSPVQNEESLAIKLKVWKNFQAPTFKLQRRTDIGAADCYVISTFSYWSFVNDTLGQFATKVYLHAASLRNGIYLAEVEIMSTMTEEESKKDLDFLLRILQQRTAVGQGGTAAPVDSSGGRAP